jgi:hypothetical protein
MTKSYFTTRDAVAISKCTDRQLWYWRQIDFINPIVEARGKGITIYYSKESVCEMLVMKHLLCKGLSFEASQRIIVYMRVHYPEFIEYDNKNGYLIAIGDNSIQKINNNEAAIASLTKGVALIPILLEQIYGTFS